ncbi:MAG: hypothetical protein ACK6BM_06295 [Cyanobacteriota bacterium]
MNFDQVLQCFKWMQISSLMLLFTQVISVNPVLAEEKSIALPGCSIATLKGTYLYSSIGVLDGKLYAESGREVYDGKGGVELTFSGSGGAAGTMRTKYSVSPDCVGKAVYPYGQTLASFISPDGSRFVYTITRGPSDRPTALSGWEIRVSP